MTHNFQARRSPRSALRALFLGTAAALALAVALPGAIVPPVLAAPVSVDAPQMPSFSQVVKAVAPAVVSVRVESRIETSSDDGGSFPRRFFGEEGERFFRNNPFFRDHPFFRDDEGRRGERGERGDRPRRFGMSQGSGFFISEDGYLVTNHHVIENGSKFTIVMDDGTELEATLVGADSRTDLAVLKAKSDRKFTYVKFDEDEPAIGDWVVAVGNPFGLGGTVTAGIISARNREISANRFDDFLQIDAAVNKGNSGGPAFNLQGEVVGINTAIFSPSGGNVGIAFAIPASTAEQVVKDLVTNGQVVRGWLGVQIQPVTREIADSLGMDEATGAIVTMPQDDSPAAKAGIRSGDVILSVDGKAMSGPRELARTVGEYAPDSKVRVSLWRNGERQEVDVTLGRLQAGEQIASLESPRNETAQALGLTLEPSTGEEGGVAVTAVEPGSQAAEKGVREGDVISSINGETVTSPADIGRVLEDVRKAGRKAALFQIRRDGEARFVALPLDQG
jgi:serine protease Do